LVPVAFGRLTAPDLTDTDLEVNEDFEGVLTIAFGDESVVIETLSMTASAARMILEELTVVLKWAWSLRPHPLALVL